MLEQSGSGAFITHVLEDSLAQAGGGLAVDLDGDGDVVPVFTGYENYVIYVYEREYPCARALRASLHRRRRGTN